MTYGYGSKFGRSNFRSPRGGRGSSFRGRGRGGSDSYHSSNRDSFSTKSNFRGSSFQSSSYRGRIDHRDSRGGGSRYGGDRYSSLHNRRDEDSGSHRREIRETASGSYGRGYLRRNDGESDRKRMRTDIGSSYKEGFSSRRSHDEFDHSSRSFRNSSSSPYRSDSSPFARKSHKDFNDFKKPLPPSDRPSYGNRRPMRGARGRGSSSMRFTTIRVNKAPLTSFVKRSAVNRFKTTSTSRLQLMLRKKKQLQILRLRKEREIRLRSSSSSKPNDDNSKSSANDQEEKRFDEDDAEMELEVDEDDDGPPGVSSPGKKLLIKIKESSDPPEKSGSHSETPKDKVTERPHYRPFSRIALKCPHCKLESKTFKLYQGHLSSHRHKVAMEKLLYNLKQKLRRLRVEQRDEQRRIDERDDNFNRTSYCKLCKLNYKQTRQEHMTSDFHVSMAEFLNCRCRICHMTFGTPLLYEHHRCTLTHIKRKAFLDRKKGLNDGDKEDENIEDENFMVLDSVGSADESNDEIDTSKDENTDSHKKISLEAKKKTTIIGSEYIKKVSIYYCKLCKLCLHYNPNRDAEECLLSHCRTRFHLKRFSLEVAKKNSETKTSSSVEGGSTGEQSIDRASVEAMDANDEENDQFWVDDEVDGNEHKSSEDEDDSHSGNRYDRFGTSDEKDSVEKVKIDPEDDDQTSKDDETGQANSNDD